MLRTDYRVVLHEGRWKITLAGKDFGPYSTQKDAIRSAVDAAHIEGQRSPFGAQVLVQGANGDFRPEWTYGRDAYPPKG